MKAEKKVSRESFLIESLKIVVDGIAKTFGSRCEVVLHDFRNLDHSIVKIANGHITGRSVGAPITDFGLKILRSGSQETLLINYPSVGKNGRKLKSSTFLFRDRARKPIAALCINFDVSDILSFNLAIQDIFEVSGIAPQEGGVETFEGNMLSTLGTTADRVIKKAGKTVLAMKTTEKIEIVRELDSQGFFLIKGAVKLLAEKMNVSKFSIYNYLGQVRAENSSFRSLTCLKKGDGILRSEQKGR
jgi:predicted transcriptional regulator YheO